MDPGKAIIIVGITLIVVVGFNVMIYLSVRGERTVSQVDLFRKAASRFRNPWQGEDDMLDELSQVTGKLKGEQRENNGEEP